MDIIVYKSTEKKIDLSKIETNVKEDKEKLKMLTEENIKKIDNLQNKLYAEAKQSLLVVLQAMDAGGKDGTIRKVFGPINPQGCRVVSFKAPTQLELSYDFLWRVHKEVPQRGMITIFNRSHYEDVLIVRVNEWITKKECERRYEHINNFEKLLIDNNTRILKFYLHISKEEQRQRLQERIDDKSKNWKFCIKDLEVRKQWDKYMEQYNEVFENCSTKDAPWYIVPADNKAYRDYVVSSIVLKTLEDMDPQYPPPEKGIENLRIE